MSIDFKNFVLLLDNKLSRETRSINGETVVSWENYAKKNISINETNIDNVVKICLRHSDTLNIYVYVVYYVREDERVNRNYHKIWFDEIDSISIT